MTANGCGAHARWTKACPACQTLARMYDRRRRSAIADGTWMFSVDAAEVRAHLDHLISVGMTVLGIARAAGLSDRTVMGVRKRIWVQGPTAAALLAVKPEPTQPSPPAGMVWVVGASRRVQGLSWMGWSLQEQADRVGMYLQQVWQISRSRQSMITVATDRTFRGLFEQLSATRGPSTRSHNAAVRSGWVPPLAWDDIDDPDEVPNLDGDGDPDIDMVAVSRALEGGRVTLSPLEQAEALRVGVARGEPLTQVADRLGLSYFIARKLLDGEPSPRQEQQARVEAALAEMGDTHKDTTIAALVGVHHQTVTRARRRLAERQQQLAS